LYINIIVVTEFCSTYVSAAQRVSPATCVNGTTLFLNFSELNLLAKIQSGLSSVIRKPEQLAGAVCISIQCNFLFAASNQ